MGTIVPDMGTHPSPPPAAPRPVRVADALFTKVQQRVLGLLFGNAGRSFYAKELIALAGSGSGAVQRELARLTSAGLVTVTQVGKQKHYQANPIAPVFAELHGLVLKTTGLADTLRAALAPIGNEVTVAFVYGSVAKGEDTATSDVDLLVVSDTLTYADVYSAVEGAATRLGRTVSPTIYTRAELTRRRTRDNAFVSRVFDGPRIWLIGDDDALGAR